MSSHDRGILGTKHVMAGWIDVRAWEFTVNAFIGSSISSATNLDCFIVCEATITITTCSIAVETETSVTTNCRNNSTFAESTLKHLVQTSTYGDRSAINDIIMVDRDSLQRHLAGVGGDMWENMADELFRAKTGKEMFGKRKQQQFQVGQTNCY